MKTKSFREYAEKRLGKGAVGEIEVEALDELESMRGRPNVISNFEYFMKYMAEDILKGLVVCLCSATAAYSMGLIIKRLA